MESNYIYDELPSLNSIGEDIKNPRYCISLSLEIDRVYAVEERDINRIGNEMIHHLMMRIFNSSMTKAIADSIKNQPKLIVLDQKLGHEKIYEYTVFH